MGEDGVIDFAARVAASRVVKPEVDDDPLGLIPTDDSPARVTTPQDDGLIDRIDIIEAYRRWCGKMEPAVGSKRESIMISCPNPNHPDSHPAAWINLDKQTWCCGPCGFEGGDKYDLAAWYFGYQVPQYKTNGDFPKLRNDVAKQLGYVIRKVGNDKERVDKILTEEEAAAVAPINDPESTATVTSIAPDLEGFQNEAYKELFGIDWRTLAAPDSFLYRWCEIAEDDDLPVEYYVWLGLMLLGFAIGHHTYLYDDPEVFGNLNVTLLGSSGLGKSKSIKRMLGFLRKALPYDTGTSAGTKIVPSPGSAEALVDEFSFPIYDPADPKKIVGYEPVNGLVRFDEFATLTGKSARAGSILKPTLMEFYDGYDVIEIKSRTHGYVRAERSFCSVVTTTQPRALNTLFAQEDADTGFLNRWVFVRGINKKLTAALPRRVDFDPCIPLLQRVRAWGSANEKINFAPSGLEVWTEFFHANIEQLRLGDSAILARVDLTLKKLMLLFAVNEEKTEVDADIVNKACAFFSSLTGAYMQVSSNVGMGELDECASAVERRIRLWASEGRPAPSTRELYRSLKRYSREQIVKATKLLVAIGTLDEKRVEPKKGPAVDRYYLTDSGG